MDGGGKQKQITTNEPWSGVKPYLLDAYGHAQSLYNQGPPQYYPGQQIAPMSSYSKNSLDAMAQRAAYGSDVTRAAQKQLTGTINGDYLNKNPYLNGAIDAAVRPITNAFEGSVMPGIDSNFSAAGRYGSGLQGEAYNDANQALAQQIGDVSTQMAYQNYGDERQRQMQAMMFAPTMANQDYVDINALGQAGQGYDQYNQSLINANINKWNYNQNVDWDYLSNYIALLNGAQGNTSVTKTPTNGMSPFTGALGGAMGGASLGSMFGPLGTGIGAIGGGLLGGFGSLF